MGKVPSSNSEENFPQNKKISPTDRSRTRVDSAPLGVRARGESEG